MKVLVIGLDGATWDLIKPWADKGELPTFKKLMENGVWGYLESTIPPWTIPAWNSIATGLNPKKLGFATFAIKKGYSFHPYFLFSKLSRNVWDFLSAKNKKVCVANVPSVSSPYSLNGYIVPGWLYTGKFTTYPSNLIVELNEVCNGYIADIIVSDVLKAEKVVGSLILHTDSEYIKKSNEVLKKHYLAFKYLITNKDWDFAFLVFAEPDRIQHRFWRNKDVVLSTYRELDKYLAGLLSLIDENTIVFLVSDHGFGTIEYRFNLNEWLIKEGYLKLKQKPNKNKLLSIANFIKNTRLFPLARKIIRILPSNLSESVMKKSSPIKFEDLEIDWKNTIAFAYGVFGAIWLNVKGREPEGAVDPAEYESIRDEIIRKLKRLKLNGKALNVKVFKKEEIYPGANMNDNLPDIVILPTDDGIQSISPNVGYGEIFTKSSGGEHRLNGIFLAYGKGIKKGYKIKGAKIYDIAPTILHIFGLPIPNDMDGRVLMEIFEPDSEVAKRKPVYVDPSYYDKLEEKQKLKAKIKELKLKKKI